MCEEGLQSPCAHRRTAPAAPAGRAAAVRSSAAALELGCDAVMVYYVYYVY
jgi:hypothetical protein